MMNTLPTLANLAEKRANRVYEALKTLGNGWHSRSEIAGQLNIKRLSAYEILALEFLVSEGRIECERREIEGPITSRWEYRIKG